MLATFKKIIKRFFFSKVQCVKSNCVYDCVPYYDGY